MFDHTIESYLSLEFCRTWAKRWRNHALLILVFFILALALQALTIATGPIPLYAWVVYALGDILLLWVTVDSTGRSWAYAKRATEMGRKGVPGW